MPKTVMMQISAPLYLLSYVTMATVLTPSNSALSLRRSLVMIKNHLCVQLASVLNLQWIVSQLHCPELECLVSLWMITAPVFHYLIPKEDSICKLELISVAVYKLHIVVQMVVANRILKIVLKYWVVMNLISNISV